MRSRWGNFKKRGIKALCSPEMAARLSGFSRLLVLLLEISWIPRRWIRQNLNYFLLLNLVLRFRGDYREALRILEQGLHFNPDSHELHLKLAEVHRENVEIESAHAHLAAAASLQPGQSTIRKLTFETNHQMYAEGGRTLSQTLGLAPGLLLSMMRAVDRVSPHYPGQAQELHLLRDSLISGLQSASHSSKGKLSKAVGSAIAMRRLDVALELERRSEVELLPDVRAQLDHLEKNLGAHLPMLDHAWANELADDPVALICGQPVKLSALDAEAHPIVEVFIPPAIFDFPRNEKQTHKTIREFYFHVIRILLGREGLAIVPRMQLDWRFCLPKTLGARVVSYHTSGPVNPRHLHIQESPLAGYCSLDHAGFAGFATTAAEHSAIVDFVAGIPDSVLEANQHRLHQHFVMRNVSKYQQPTLAAALPISEPYVFVVLQVSTDIVAQLGWLSGIDLLAGVVEHYRGSGTRVVVKSHPFCRSIRVADFLDQLESGGEIIRGTGSIHHLIRDARLVLTVNSGVGLESLMHGKAVVVAGACDYCYAATTVKTREELKCALETAAPPDPRRIRQLLYYYVHRFAVRADAPDQIRGRLEEWLP